MNRLLVAGAYLALFWTIYPVAEAIAWAWSGWDNLSARRNTHLHTVGNWYTG
jgi:hypothetical protein